MYLFMAQDTDKIKRLLRRRLLAWYQRHQRALPWRETNDPYRVWISEIMLQQTQVDTAIPFYRRFLKTFPDVDTLARAPLQEVLKAWENLGYYSRARNIHAAARIIVDQFDGKIPDTFEAIRTLPGIGQYSAGAILSIAYGKPFPAVDGNVRRILCRVFAIRKPMNELRDQKELFKLAGALVPARRPGDFNQALMDLGAMICRAKSPNCQRCPLAVLCLAQAGGLQNDLPVTRKTPGVPHRHALAAVIRNPGGKLLVVQRPASGLLASLWKLPGGFIDDIKKMEPGLKNQVRDELGLSILVGERLAAVDHTYTHFRLTLHAFAGFLVKGRPHALNCQDCQWASPEDLKKLPMSKIDRMIIAAVLTF